MIIWYYTTLLYQEKVMTIKKTKNSEYEYAVSILQARLDNLLRDHYLEKLPLDIKQKLQDFHDELGNYKVANDKTQYKTIKGKILTDKELKKNIVAATGYTKWELVETEQLDQEEIERIHNEFGVTFVEQDIYRYRYYRETASRNDVNSITITALPGYNEVSIDTDRADTYFEGLVKSSDLKKQIEENMD